MNEIDELISQIQGLSDSDLVEASIYYFSDKFDVSSREEIQSKLLSFCEEKKTDFSELMSIESQIEKDRASYRKLLRFLLIHELQNGDDGFHKVKEAVEAVGQKQVITEIGLAIILGTLATVVLVGYIGAYTEGKVKETEEKIYEIKPDGTVLLIERKETEYVDALSPLGKLFGYFSGLHKKE